jgi:DNA-binding NtrC family response regulator
VRAGSFREDLYYRLHVIPVEVPPLRRRVEDLPWLAERLLAEAVARFDLGARRLAPAALASLTDHDWPGNVRELRNRIERAVALAESEEIGVADLFPERRLDEGAGPAGATRLGVAIDGATRDAITDALQRVGGNRAEAARRLGISRTTLWKRMRELGMAAD